MYCGKAKWGEVSSERKNWMKSEQKKGRCHYGRGGEEKARVKERGNMQEMRREERYEEKHSRERRNCRKSNKECQED